METVSFGLRYWASERKSTFDGLVAFGFAPTGDYQPFRIHGSEMFRSLEAESDVGPSDQHDLAGEVFSYEGYRMRPLFAQELEEGALGHGVLDGGEMV